jgi:hypothetical protein
MRRLGAYSLIAWSAALGLATAQAGEMTAFQLVKEGNRHVGEEAKDRVVQIRSEKSVGGLEPNIWFIVYYDRDAATKATEVKFAGGKKVSVKRPPRIWELTSSAHKELPKEKLKVDSDKAIAITKKEPVLKNLQLTNARLILERWHDDPVWKVRLWAAKIRNPKDTADIGEVFVAAEDGKVVRNDLHPGRVD